MGLNEPFVFVYNPLQKASEDNK